MLKIDEKFCIKHISKEIYDRIFDNEFSFQGESHNFWEAVYVVDGKIEVAENEKIYIMSDGDIIFHAPMEFHKIQAAEKTAPHVLNMSFTVVGSMPQNLKDGIFHLDEKERNLYLNLFRFIKESFIENETPGPFTGQEAGVRLSSFILYLCNHEKAQEVLSPTIPAFTYNSLVQLMRKEINNNLSIQTLSEKSFISISYIKILFRRYAGMSPKKYYNNLRVLKAKELLEQGLSVTDVANKMNFSSPNHFVRFFKSMTMITPHQYKMQNLLS